jgi:hypothetical protein
MNILINESQYKRLFRPNVKIELIEGSEAEKYLNLLYENDRLLKDGYTEDYEFLVEGIKEDCDEIDKNKFLAQDVKDRRILDLVGEPDLHYKLQNWVNNNIYNAEINGITLLKSGNKRFTFNVTLHWAARIFRDCSKPTIPWTKGLELVRDGIDKIIEFINKSVSEFNIKDAIVLSMTEEGLYNQVIVIRKERNIKNLYNIDFITQLEKEHLYNKYRYPRIYI